METGRIQVPARLGAQSIAGFAAELEAAAANREVRVIVLEGSSEVFCRGLDTDELLQTSDPEVRLCAIEGFQRCLRAIRVGPKPTIAVVDAPAQGGGVGVAAAADLVLATERASFALPESLFGLIPAMVLPLLLERMRPQLARLWGLTAESHGAEEALAAGLVDRVAPHAELERAVRRAMRELGRPRPSGVAALRRFSARALELPLEQALAEGGALTLAASQEPAVVRALHDFREHGFIGWSDEDRT